ncbi:hypothetical protein SE17_11140 [Kouleothrix aurantiaca]|uniref:Uncharacterized protein n=1 Tax=Kouleothrix aurantiaca TaxID=186479 RepID=A0A0P9FJ76_9CHLR|nr:hypothetical protein SE17_11140 [Kouleothrix aurantiaca]
MYPFRGGLFDGAAFFVAIKEKEKFVIDEYAANCCSICGCSVSGSVRGIPRYFCAEDYKAFEEDIIGKAPWVTFLRLQESRRRKRRTRRIDGGVPAPLSYEQMVALGRL